MKDGDDGGEEPNSDTNKRKLEANVEPRTDQEGSKAKSKRPTAASASQNLPLSLSPIPIASGTQAGSSHGIQIMTKIIKIPKDKAVLIIQRYLELQLKAKVQVAKDCEANPESETSDVELMGTAEQITMGEQFINELIAKADSGANQGMTPNQPGAEQFVMEIPNNKKRWVNTYETTTSYAQPTYPPNWSQAGHQPSLQQQQQQLPQYGYTPGTNPPAPSPQYYSYQPRVGSCDYAHQSTEQSTGCTSSGQQSQVGSAPPPYNGYTYAQLASNGTRGYDQSYSIQASSYGQHFSDQIPPPPGVPSTNATSSESRCLSAAYKVSNSLPVVNPGYSTYPSYPTQSLRPTGNDQSGYNQTVSEGQEQPQLVYAHSGYLPQPRLAPLPQARAPQPRIGPLPRPQAPTPRIAPLPRPRAPSPRIAPLPRPQAPQPRIAPLPRPRAPPQPQPEDQTRANRG